MNVQLREEHLLRLMAVVDVGERAIVRMRRELEERGGMPDDVMAALIAYGWCRAGGVWLGEEHTLVHGDREAWESAPCLEPRGQEPDRYSGSICDGEARFVVWGGRGTEQGYAVAYPACEAHARRWGQGHEIDTGELVVFDPDLQGAA